MESPFLLGRRLVLGLAHHAVPLPERCGRSTADQCVSLMGHCEARSKCPKRSVLSENSYARRIRTGSTLEALHAGKKQANDAVANNMTLAHP
jgi:hypothetical protein